MNNSLGYLHFVSFRVRLLINEVLLRDHLAYPEEGICGLFVCTGWSKDGGGGGSRRVGEEMEEGVGIDKGESRLGVTDNKKIKVVTVAFPKYRYTIIG